MTIRTFIFNPFMELTYVVSDDSNNAVIIDCGCRTEKEQQQLLHYIDGNNLRPIALLNTHFHLDHQFGNALINRRYGLIPYGSELDRPLLDTVDAQCGWFGIEPNGETIKDIHPVTDGQQLDFDGIRFEVISTPGHTPGGVCYLLKRDGEPDVLFSGDTLFCGGMGRTDLPYGNYGDLIDSIQNKLMLLSPDTIVCPGHGVKTTIGNEMTCY